MLLRGLATFFEVLTLLGALAGGICVILSIAPGNSAIQTGTFSAFGIGLAVIPYTIAGIFHRGAVRQIMVANRRDEFPDA